MVVANKPNDTFCKGAEGVLSNGSVMCGGVLVAEGVRSRVLGLVDSCQNSEFIPERVPHLPGIAVADLSRTSQEGRLAPLSANQRGQASLPDLFYLRRILDSYAEGVR